MAETTALVDSVKRLNVSYDPGSRPGEFSLKDIEVLVDNKEQNWFKRTHIGRYLGIARIITSTTKLSEEDKRSRTFLQTEEGCHIMNPPRKDAQDHDIFLSEAGALYVLNKYGKSTNKLNALADILEVKIHKNKWLFNKQESFQNIMDVFKDEEMLMYIELIFIFQHTSWLLNGMNLVIRIDILNTKLGDKNTFPLHFKIVGINMELFCVW